MLNAELKSSVVVALIQVWWSVNDIESSVDWFEWYANCSVSSLRRGGYSYVSRGA